MTAKIIDGKKIGHEMRQTIAQELQKLEARYHVKPNIASVTIGANPLSNLHMRLRTKASDEVGITSTNLKLPHDTSELDVLKTIETLNNDNDIHGILIQYPVPNQINPHSLMAAVNPRKDVEGLHPCNIGRISLGDEKIIPCTPLAVLSILEYEHTDIKAKNVVVVNHSPVVGKPLATLFLNRNATVSVCHIFTKDIKMYTTQADILVSATGKSKLITRDYIKDNTFVIDIGIIKTQEGICGDVDLEDIMDKAGKITPVPGGVGPVTIACSLKNMVQTFKNCIEGKQ